ETATELRMAWLGSVGFIDVLLGFRIPQEIGKCNTSFVLKILIARWSRSIAYYQSVAQALVFFIFAAFATAQNIRLDAKLEGLRQILTPMRSNWSPDSDTRGVTPQLTLAKHELRDWVELQLPRPDFNPAALAVKLNAALNARGLVFDAVAHGEGAGPSEPG